MRIALLLLVLIVFVIGGFVGWGLTQARDGMLVTNQDGFIPGIGGGPGDEASSDNLQQQLELNNLLRDHSNLTIHYLQGIHDGENVSATKSLVDDNSEQIIDFFVSKFGKSIEEDFGGMWKRHIEQYAIYTSALKNNDAVGMGQATQNLTNITLAMGNHFNRLNKSYSGVEIANLMDDHMNLTLATLNAYSDDDTASMVSYIKTSLDQSARFAEYLIVNAPQ